MPLPAGFKVNGVKTTVPSRVPLSPRAQKVAAILDALPFTELKTTMQVSELAMSDLNTGGISTHPGLRDYREKVDNKMFWGNRKTIAQLRQQLAKIAEEPNGKS